MNDGVVGIKEDKAWRRSTEGAGGNPTYSLQQLYYKTVLRIAELITRVDDYDTVLAPKKGCYAFSVADSEEQLSSPTRLEDMSPSCDTIRSL